MPRVEPAHPDHGAKTARGCFLPLVKFQQRYQTRQAISLIPFDRLDFRTLGYPKNGAAFSPPILGVEFRCCLAASRPRNHTLEGEPERMRFAGRADSIGRTYQDDSERSSRRKAHEAETGCEPTGS